MPKRCDKQERGSGKQPSAGRAMRSGQPPVGKAPPAGRSTTDGGELRRFEPVSDELLLAAIDRAERHRPDGQQSVHFSDIVAHLGFARSGWTTRQLRPQMDALITGGLLAQGRRHGFDVWGLTDTGRSRLKTARRAGKIGQLPESPQHREWCYARATAAERIDGFRASARRDTEEAVALLGSRQRVGSDAWLQLAARFERTVRQLGLATYCLYEWGEPDDDRADIDSYQDARDEQLDETVRARLRSLRRYRRNITNLTHTDDEQSAPAPADMITVPAEMVGELRHGLHTVLGDAAEGVSQITEQFGRERHPEWYAEQRERFERAWALLDLIGWREPKQPTAVRINLREQHRAVNEALDTRLMVAADDLKEADAVDAERAEQGEPPISEATTNRVLALREFASSVKGLVGHLDTPQAGSGDE
jgi:hypothetical protein